MKIYSWRELYELGEQMAEAVRKLPEEHQAGLLAEFREQKAALDAINVPSGWHSGVINALGEAAYDRRLHDPVEVLDEPVVVATGELVTLPELAKLLDYPEKS